MTAMRPRRGVPLALASFAALALLSLGDRANGATEVTSFRTPSGSIGCVYARGLGRTEIRCDIVAAYAKPEARRPKSCDLDWGDSLVMGATGGAGYGCHGDTALNQGRVLAYGTTFRRPGFACVSRTVGLRCTNKAGHGWDMSRQRQRRF